MTSFWGLSPILGTPEGPGLSSQINCHPPPSRLRNKLLFEERRGEEAAIPPHVSETQTKARLKV